MDELVDRVREALEGEYSGAPNGRVRDVPDRRAIRWYTTIGLVDRPLGMRGRTALYGPRHLQQLVAIKRWQADGRSLAQIQADFARLTPDGLADASRVPERLLDRGDSDSVSAKPDIVFRPRFWADAPATAAPEPAPAAPATLSLSATDIVADPVHSDPVHGVSLGGGAILLLPRPVDDNDRAAVAAAAAPLLALLESRGLIVGRKS
jgi:hypothetical protein